MQPEKIRLTSMAVVTLFIAVVGIIISNNFFDISMAKLISFLFSLTLFILINTFTLHKMESMFICVKILMYRVHVLDDKVMGL